MNEQPLILKTPKEHFAEATISAILGAYSQARSSELAVINPIEAHLLKRMSEESIKRAIYQLSYGLAAVALLGKVGVPYLNSLDPRLREIVQKHISTAS